MFIKHRNLRIICMALFVFLIIFVSSCSVYASNNSTNLVNEPNKTSLNINSSGEIIVNPPLRGRDIDIKFLTKEAYCDKKTKIKIKLIENGEPVKNMRVDFYYFKSDDPFNTADVIGKTRTNSKGIAYVNCRFTLSGPEFVGITKHDGAISWGPNYGVIRVYGSLLKEKNTFSVGKKKIRVKNFFKNKGPESTNFKLYYKVPKGLKYVKPKILGKYSKSYKIKYNSKKRYVRIIVKGLKPNKKLFVIWAPSAKSGNYTIKPVIKKPGTTKLKGNNPLKGIIVK